LWVGDTIRERTANSHAGVLCASAAIMGRAEYAKNSRRIEHMIVRWSLNLFWCWMSFAALCSAQSFLFVSPNTRNQMTDEFASASLDSFEQTNFLAVANFLASKLCFKPEVLSTEGMDGTNTENSSLVTGCKTSQAQYLGELLARYAHQKWILIFDPVPEAAGRLMIVSFNSEHPADTTKQLRNYGIKEGTIVVREKLVRFYLWAPDHQLDAPVRSFADANHGTIQEIAGKAEFIGDDSRARAQQIFDKKIRNYEHAHHSSMSKLLWSRHLHDLGISSAQ